MRHALRRARWLRPSDGRWTRDGAGPGSEPRGGTDPDVLRGASPGGGCAFPDAGGLLGRARPRDKARGPAENGGEAEGNGGTVVGAKEPESLWATAQSLAATQSEPGTSTGGGREPGKTFRKVVRSARADPSRPGERGRALAEGPEALRLHVLTGERWAYLAREYVDRRHVGRREVGEASEGHEPRAEVSPIPAAGAGARMTATLVA